LCEVRNLLAAVRLVLLAVFVALFRARPIAEATDAPLVAERTT
jgi:hypothetical protein